MPRGNPGVSRGDVDERFWSKVAWQTPTENGCWEWQATRHRQGYGMFWNGEKMVYAHVWAFEWAYGPTNLDVLHWCDNPPCCNFNIDHLHDGTHRMNIQESVDRGRHARTATRGILHGNAKVTDEQVEAIRRSTEMQKVLAEKNGISQSYVSALKRGLWRKNPTGIVLLRDK